MDIINKLNWVDLLVIILLGRMSYVALEDGLSHQIFPLVTSACNIVISLHYYHTIAVFLSGVIFLPIEAANFVSFTAMVITMGLVFRTIKEPLDKIIKLSWHPVLEKVGGFIVGILRASILVSMVLIMIALAPFDYFTQSIRDNSVTGMHLLKIGPNLYEQAVKMMAPKVANAEDLSDKLVHDIVAAKADVPDVRSVREKAPMWEKAFK